MHKSAGLMLQSLYCSSKYATVLRCVYPLKTPTPPPPRGIRDVHSFYFICMIYFLTQPSFFLSPSLQTVLRCFVGLQCIILLRQPALPIMRQDGEQQQPLQKGDLVEYRAWKDSEGRLMAVRVERAKERPRPKGGGGSGGGTRATQAHFR